MPSATITDYEKKRRRQAVDFAQASVGLEGFRISPEHAALAELYVAGEIEFAELLSQAASSTAAQTKSPDGQPA